MKSLKKRYLLLTGYASLMMVCSTSVNGQQGVLLPQSREDHHVYSEEGRRHGSANEVENAAPPALRRQAPAGTEPVSSGPQPEVAPRRWPPSIPADTIGGPDKVGHTFGAGESSVVNAHIVAWPQNAPADPLDEIKVGSADSQNAVIGIYDNNGETAGDLEHVRFYNKQEGTTPPGGVGSPDATDPANFPSDTARQSVTESIYDGPDSQYGALRMYIPSIRYVPEKDIIADPEAFYYSSYFPGSSRPSVTDPLYIPVELHYVYVDDGFNTYIGSLYYPYKDPSDLKYHVPMHTHLRRWLPLETFTFSGAPADTLYTTTRNVSDKFDDGQPLLYSHNGNYWMDNDEGKFDSTLAHVNTQYLRPTTVLLSGSNRLNSITVGDVEWYAAYLSGEEQGLDSIVEYVFNPNNGSLCDYFSGWISYERKNMKFGTPFDFAASGRYVDAAVRLLDGADVSVQGGVLDATTTYHSLHDTTNLTDDVLRTNAVLVLPGKDNSLGERSNFRLKIGGDATLLHTQDSGAYNSAGAGPLADGYLYSYWGKGGAGAIFPLSQDSVYLSAGTGNYYDEVFYLSNYDHPRETRTLTDFTGGDSTKYMPYSRTYASVYGVKGDYHGNTPIFTRTYAKNDTTGIIEIGPATRGQDSLKIYSSGMLKNFRSEYYPQADILTIGVDGTAPGFNLSNNFMPLYIINDGTENNSYKPEAGIWFNKAGVDSINAAIANATGGGDLHIQANSFVKFNGGSSLNLSLKEDNEVKILSDGNAIYVQENLQFENADTAHLTLWAKGAADVNRGIMPASGQTGAIQIGGSVTAAYDNINGTKGTGLILLRSEEDDVLVGNAFTFDNQRVNPGSGELMVQAGQDVRIDGGVTLTQNGPRSMLFEAQKTAYFGQAFDVTRDGVSNGDLTVKAGYQGFLLTADVNAPLIWGGTCVAAGGYHNYGPGQQASDTGGDIWFGGPVRINLTPAKADSVDTYIRAYNSIYLNDGVTYSLASAALYTPGSEYADTTMLYAETGNIEAHSAGDVTFNISGNDSMYLLLQAGNVPGNPYAASSCLPADNEWKGNILFHENKTLTINHGGTGPTLISASRDIENQEGAGFTFTYGNGALGDKDNLLITAGRHIEAHASYTFNYTTTTAITNDITMQAGHLAGGSDDYLPKATESASNPENHLTNGYLNDFATGGEGHGSILLFDSVTYNYLGQGAILMTALNGNIENDPHLYGAYPNDAPIVFNRTGTGITRLEAIDIKLHDRLEYNGKSDIEIFAFDSILTRSLAYNNPADMGSVYITANKLKRNVSGSPDYNASAGGPGIHQGHIVLGYGADVAGSNVNDSIVFNFKGNTSATGANVYIRAGYDGFADNPVTGKSNSSTLFQNRPDDAGKAYGGNITFDYIKADMSTGNHTAGGYMEISTPNGNIWGKDSISFNAWDGDLLVDAGLGSLDDILRATRWNTFSDYSHGNGSEPILNTCVPLSCPENGEEWRTGNIMMKGAMITFNNGAGNATFRTREGYIDTYDAFTAADMGGHILKYAGMDDASKARRNSWGDVSERDFQYTPSTNSGSVFFGADDNIMLNYGNSNFRYSAYGNGNMGYPGNYDPQAVNISNNPFYYTSYKGYINGLPASTFNVNKDGYLFYRNPGYTPNRQSHLLYRGCTGADCSGVAGNCNTTSNGARDLAFDYRSSLSGGIASVASNYIDLFTAFDYHGGQGSGLHAVPGRTHLHGEPVSGYGLYIKSQFNGEGKNQPEKRRATCEGCGVLTSWPIGDAQSAAIPEMTYIGFHDDARIHTNNQKSLLEAPVIEFFGHAELDSETDRGGNTKITLKGDSLIFHDSVIFDGSSIELIPFTTDAAQRANDMRYGVINDRGKTTANYSIYGPAIAMEDRGLPVLELGYQRCSEPGVTLNSAPNVRSANGQEGTPTVGGDVVVAFKHGYSMPIFNSVVANNARISFIGDLHDGVTGGEYRDAFIRTDLLRIRNKVEFYTDPQQPEIRSGKFVLATPAQMDDQIVAPGIYTRHLHTEPGSELSIPGEDSLIIIENTVVGGYGNIHENVFVKANGVLAPGFASIMESDCQNPGTQGTLTVQNLQMEKDAVLRISIKQNPETVNGERVYRTRADMIAIKDVFLTTGKVPLVILPETETLEPGYYPIITYGDSSGASRESAKNLVLTMQRHEGNYYTLDFSEEGMIGLSVTDFPIPDVQRYVDLPAVEGVTTEPASFRHYVSGNKNFTFTATFTGAPLKVTATGFYSAQTVDLDKTAKILGTNFYEYTIYRVVEPWTIHIGPNASTVLSDVSNDFTAGRRVWAYRNTLYINAEKDDVVSIYNMTGVMNNRINVPEGMTTLTLEKGIYVVKLKDGSTHRIIIQ
jgi:hypothetical protein